MVAPTLQTMPQVTSTRYTPIFELGRGGMAIVYLAVVRGPGGFNKLQVIKQLKAELAGDQEFLTMFLDEAKLSARINHPNVVQTNEVGFDGKSYFIAMEYLDGQSLDAVIRRSTEGTKSLTLAMYLRIIIETLQGLHYAHGLKGFDGKDLYVVHRDMSPHNIFLTYDGQVKIVDFGIAKAADSSHETRTGVLKGKVAYMSPEQVGSKAIVDRRSDIFAVGAILWRVLAGTRMWKGLNEMEILLRVTRGEIPSPVTVKPDASPELVEICMKALSFDPELRFQTALEMQEALEKWLEKQGDRTTARESGKVVAALFEDRRKEVAAAIESRLGSSVVDEASSVPQLVQLSIPSALDSGPVSASVPNMTLPNQVTTTAPMPKPQLAVPPSAYATLASPTKRGGSRRRFVGALLLVVVLAAGAVLWMRHRDAVASGASDATHSPALIETAMTPAPPPITTAPTPADTSTIELRLQLTPGNANVFVDDQPLASTLRYPRDGAAHRVRAEAPGYEAQTVFAPFDRDTIDLTFTLKATDKPDRPDTRRAAGRGRSPEPPVADNPPPPPPPPMTTAATPPPAPTPATTNKLRIDTDDPYAKYPKKN